MRVKLAASISYILDLVLLFSSVINKDNDTFMHIEQTVTAIPVIAINSLR